MFPKLSKSASMSGARYKSSLERSTTRLMRRQSYGRIDPPDSSESNMPSSHSFRVPKRLRIPKLRNRKVDSSSSSTTTTTTNKKAEVGKPGRSAAQGSSTSFLGRLRQSYERLLLKAASKSGEFSAVPVAQATRAPPALASAIDSWSLGTAAGSRKSMKIRDLDPGFEMTTAERKYVEHLRRTASYGRM